MRRVRDLFNLFSSLLSIFLLADEGHHHAMTAEELGTVHFETSCSPGSRPISIARGPAHSFWYEEAEKTFSQGSARG